MEQKKDPRPLKRLRRNGRRHSLYIRRGFFSSFGIFCSCVNSRRAFCPENLLLRRIEKAAAAAEWRKFYVPEL